MTSPTPLVTVGMAVYNGEEYIREAIASVQAETFTDWELLAVNDCSPDGSADIIRELSDPRIRLVENESNLGLVGVRNLIMDQARGSYVAWLDQDDLTYPERLASQVGFLEDNPEYSLCGSWTATRIEHADGSTENVTQRLPASHDEIRAALMFLNPIACNTVTMRRSDFLSRDLWFRPAFGNSLDYDLWSNASDVLRVCNLPTVLGAYRVHGSQTSQGAALERMNAHALQIQAELADRALGIEMTDDDRRWHRLATIAPVVVEDAAHLDHVAAWFGRLRAANVSRAAFDRGQFDRALARQWTTVVRSALRSGVPRTTVIPKAMSGMRAIGIPAPAMGASVVEGLRRRQARGV